MPNGRDFVETAATAMAAARDAQVPKRPLGKTGLEVSIFGLGGARIGMLLDNKVALDVVRRCYDLGVNYFDAAAAGAYGLSRTRYGVPRKGVCDKIVLATKTWRRTPDWASRVHGCANGGRNPNFRCDLFGSGSIWNCALAATERYLTYCM